MHFQMAFPNNIFPIDTLRVTDQTPQWQHFDSHHCVYTEIENSHKVRPGNTGVSSEQIKTSILQAWEQSFQTSSYNVS